LGKLNLQNKKDGVYSGEVYTGIVNVLVEVRVEDGKITAVDIVRHDNGKGSPAEIIVDRIIDAQSLKVDLISKATYSSKAILKAVENALQ